VRVVFAYWSDAIRALCHWLHAQPCVVVFFFLIHLFTCAYIVWVISPLFPVCF
jgi:hypothetical protein